MHFERIDSTNSEARRQAGQGGRGPLWIVADEQTGGRGRLGRSWVSERGNLYATLLFTLDAPPSVAVQAGFVAAVAVREAVAAALPHLAPRIKWPNDLLIGPAKFCGLLAEIVGLEPTRIAVGCGINIAHAPRDTPYPVTFLGAGTAVESFFQQLDSSLSTCLKIWDEGRGFAAIRTAWSAHALGLGEACETERGAGTFSGIAADGALILTQANGARQHIHSGEVRFAEIEVLRKA